VAILLQSFLYLLFALLVAVFTLPLRIGLCAALFRKGFSALLRVPPRPPLRLLFPRYPLLLMLFLRFLLRLLRAKPAVFLRLFDLLLFLQIALAALLF